MWLDDASQQVVDEFWRRCRESEAFPRRLERPLALALPVALVKLPRLRLQDIERWLRRRGLAFAFGCDSRAVRGCLLAHAGQGLLFVDGADPDDEQRFTIAHETAHFLVDYWLPRIRAAARLRPEAAEVMDGVRPATITERVHAVLGSVPIGPYWSLMERNLAADTAELWEAENRADRVAAALLAPPQAVLPLIDLAVGPFARRLNQVENVLREGFGLPGPVAAGYGRALLVAAGRGPSWVEALGLG
jgi:hypothetical protein